MLHGNGSLIEDFLTSGLVQMAARRHRVIVFDRPGYGWSDRPRDTIWTPRAQAELLEAACRKLGIGRAHVLGHSWGTLVALEWALRHPGSVSALTLVSGYHYPTIRPDVVLLAGPSVPVVGDLLRFTIVPVLARLSWPRIVRKLFRPSPTPPHFRQVPKDLVLSPRSIRASAEESALMIPSAARLQHRYRALTTPVSIVAGSGDRVVDPRRHAERLHADIAGSRLFILPGVGHMVLHTDPQSLMAAVDAGAAAARPLPADQP
jgi:pimeloyl-ACP methyl ester carboxylesterase